MKSAGALICAVIVALALWWQRTPDESAANSDLRGNLSTPPLIAQDRSGNGYSGVIQGRPEVGLPGRRGTAYSFGRMGSWIQVPSQPDLNPHDEDFLFSAWVNFTEPPTPRGKVDLIRKGLRYGGMFRLRVLADGRIRCTAQGDGRAGRVSVMGKKASLFEGRWHYVACARTRSTWSVIVDDSITSKRANVGSIRTTMPLAIGSRYGLDDAPQGRVDEVTLIIGGSSGDSMSKSRDVAAAVQHLQDLSPTAKWSLDETSPSEIPGL